MHLRPIDYVLWLSAPIMQLGVLTAMYKRGFWRDYPYFFLYTLLQVAGEPVLFYTQRQSYSQYYYSYWTSVALSAVFSFAVLYEIFREAFRPYQALRDLSLILFRWAALVLCLMGGMWAISSGLSADGGQLTVAIMVAERSVRLMQCGLVFFLLLFSEYLGISRRNIVFGIALGFGLFAAVNMLIAVSMTHPVYLHRQTLRWINSAAYNVSVVIWLSYALRAPARRSISSTARPQDWNYALEDRLQPEADSLLDTMDRTVERLLYPAKESRVSVSSAHN